MAEDEREPGLRAPPGLPGLLRARREPALVRDAQRGSSEALEELFRRHWRRAHRAAYLVVADPSAAEDIAQESSAAIRRSTGSTAGARSAPGCTGSPSTGRSTTPGPGRCGARVRSLPPPSPPLRIPTRSRIRSSPRSPGSRQSTGRWSCSGTCSSTRPARSPRCSARAGPSTAPAARPRPAPTRGGGGRAMTRGPDPPPACTTSACPGEEEA